MNTSTDAIKSDSNIHGLLISGEVSEEEEEEDIFDIEFTEGESFTSIDSRLEKETLKKKKESLLEKSLLHQKLYERNVSLRKKFETRFHEPLKVSAFQSTWLRTRMTPVVHRTMEAKTLIEKASQNVQDICTLLQNLPSPVPLLNPPLPKQ